jgi:hypothetical protein
MLQSFLSLKQWSSSFHLSTSHHCVLSACLSAYLSLSCILSDCLSAYMSLSHFLQSFRLPVYLPLSCTLSVLLSVYLSICPRPVLHSVRPSVCLSVPVLHSVRSSVCLSIYLCLSCTVYLPPSRFLSDGLFPKMFLYCILSYCLSTSVPVLYSVYCLSAYLSLSCVLSG